MIFSWLKKSLSARWLIHKLTSLRLHWQQVSEKCPVSRAPHWSTLLTWCFDWSISSVYAASSCSGFILFSLAEHFVSFTPTACRPWWSTVALCHKVQSCLPYVYLIYGKKTLLQQMMWDSTLMPMILNSTSCHRQEAMTAAHTLEACVTDVTSWINMNRLKLNADKTALPWAGSKYSSALLGAETIKASDHAHLLGVTTSSDLSLD